MADSRLFVGGMVLSIIACRSGEDIQLSFELIRTPPGPRNSRVGSASLPGTVREGPIARTITFFGCVPVTMKPPMSTLSLVSARRRVEIFKSWLVVAENSEVLPLGSVAVAVTRGAAVPVARLTLKL